GDGRKERACSVPCGRTVHPDSNTALRDRAAPEPAPVAEPSRNEEVEDEVGGEPEAEGDREADAEPRERRPGQEDSRRQDAQGHQLPPADARGQVPRDETGDPGGSEDGEYRRHEERAAAQLRQG